MCAHPTLLVHHPEGGARALSCRASHPAPSPWVELGSTQVVLCCVVLFCVALCCVALYCVVLYCVVLCCRVIRCFVLVFFVVSSCVVFFGFLCCHGVDKGGGLLFTSVLGLCQQNTGGGGGVFFTSVLAGRVNTPFAQGSPLCYHTTLSVFRLLVGPRVVSLGVCGIVGGSASARVLPYTVLTSRAGHVVTACMNFPCTC